MEFKTFNPRISLLTIKAYWFNFTIISVHAPTEEKTQEEKYDFYDELTSVVDGIPNNRIVVILRDLNAKVGKELIFKPTIGHHILHEVTNNNGLNLIDFATGKSLVFKSTMFPHKKIHKGTWKSPDGNHTNQIDHVLVNGRLKNSITDVKTMRGADCDSDYYLVKDPIETFTWTRTKPNLNECTTLSKQEVELQIRRLKNYKAPGEDGIQGEIMKMLDEDSLTHIHRLLTLIWEQEVLPEGWNVAVICPIHKKGDPQILCRKLIMMANKVGLETNYEKTEYMILSRQDREYQQGQSMNVEGRVFKRVTHFKYLGHLITQDNDLKKEVSARIQKGNKSFFGLGKVLSSRTFSTNLKIQMYMTLIRTIVLYTAETWPLRKAEETRIKVFERRILRKIYGPCFDANTGEWRKHNNKKLEELFQRPNIANEIKKRRLTWARHAWRRVGSIVRITIEENPVSKRPLGRPRLRWEDCVKRDMECIKPEIPWRVVTENRDRWREICL
ncbi:hypothetical protein QTP88_018019 [Uroleucon formosanum]